MRTNYSIPAYLNQTLWRSIAAVIIFAALTALSARVAIRLSFTPVPITFQPLAVVLSGLVLGARGGAAAQLAYLGAMAMGFPVDASGLGAAAFLGPTAGYLVGFAPAAFGAGWLAEQFSPQSWWGNFLAALVGMIVIYVAGVSWLAVLLGSWQTAWVEGVVPFIGLDLAKAAVAAAAAESGKLLLRGES